MKNNQLTKMIRGVKYIKSALSLGLGLILMSAVLPTFLVLILKNFPKSAFDAQITTFKTLILVFLISLLAIMFILWLVYYILSIVACFDTKKVYNILLLVGFLIPIVAIVGLFWKHIALSREISSYSVTVPYSDFQKQA